MFSISEINEKLNRGEFNRIFSNLYGSEEDVVNTQKNRYINAVKSFSELFPNFNDIRVFSASGRTEIGGNHTDHQHGCVLAAAVNLDSIAIAAPNNTNTINLKSEGMPIFNVNLDSLEISEKEKGSSAALIRGISARLKELGYKIGGFNAYMTSDVLRGSGLSSSAAFETLVGTIISYLFNDGKVSAVDIAKIGQYSENVYFGKICGLMDQMVSSVGGFVSIDFNDTENPIIEKVEFDFNKSGYCLCIVDTKGNHADLTPDYEAIPLEMKQVAAFFGKDYLREVDEDEFYKNIKQIREKVSSDRAILRAIHFFKDNKTAIDEATALKNGDFDLFKKLVQSSGDSSFKFLQNIYSNSDINEQGVALGIAISESILGGRGACRVHGGGFAGTMQSFVPLDIKEDYKKKMEEVFGEGSCYVLNIRPLGGIEIKL